jgi:hypothetical protein
MRPSTPRQPWARVATRRPPPRRNRRLPKFCPIAGRADLAGSRRVPRRAWSTLPEFGDESAFGRGIGSPRVRPGLHHPDIARARHVDPTALRRPLKWAAKVPRWERVGRTRHKPSIGSHPGRRRIRVGIGTAHDLRMHCHSIPPTYSRFRLSGIGGVGSCSPV